MWEEGEEQEEEEQEGTGEQVREAGAGQRQREALRREGARWTGRRRLPGDATETISATTVSPQHPCEVGWKVATIVMPTSQTRPGHRGERD